MKLDIAIVGAGLGGLSLALALQRVGFSPRVYDQTPALGEVGAGIGLWPGALRSLAEIGIAEWFWKLPVCRFRRAETCSPDGRVLTGFDVSGITGGEGFVVRRTDLHRAMLEQLDPARLTLGAELIGLSQDSDGVTLRFADGRTAGADIVVGADGLRSVVRAATVGSSEPRYSGETCYRGMARVSVTDTGILREVQGRGRRCAVHPLDDDHVYWWAAVRTPAGWQDDPTQRKEVLAQAFRGWEFGFPEALAATSADSILRNDLFDRPALKQWSHGRVTLLGDAAHPTTPNLGLGGCMAIEDGLVLARALAENGGQPAAAFAQYEQERHKRTARVVRMSAMFGRMGSLTGPRQARLREAVMSHTPTALMARTFADPVGYQPGPLTR
jgi:2-polyprenyl-6-methoxyphenol hydroxylase-like FAD-dependent oxidoreductase